MSISAQPSTLELDGPHGRLSAQAAARARTAEWRWVVVVSLIVLCAAYALNIWAELTTPPAYHFAGLVYNWQDGNSYLAKLREGVRGEWLYRVPFTAEPGNGTFLYPHYLLLGHVARWLALEPVVVFNIARLAAGGVLLLSLYAFISCFFTRTSERRWAFLLTAVGSGMGWVLLPFGTLTPDFWQAEIFPFLSILSNPHFTLALAALLWLLTLLVLYGHAFGARQWLTLVAGTLIVALLQPYGLVNVGAVAVLWLLIRWRRERHVPRDLLLKLLVMVALAAPYVLYTQWVVLSDPTLVGWDLQNQTNSPALWQYVVAFGLALPLALWGMRNALRRRRAHDLLLVFWVVSSLLLMYLPNYHQQRRFAFGLFVPLAILAMQGLLSLPRVDRPSLRAALVATSTLTNITLLLIAFAAMQNFAPYLYFTRGEWNALLFLREHAEQHALVLASPDFGLYIPAWSGQRVIYGHPHETADARAHAEAVQSFYRGTLRDPQDFTARVDYIIVGPRERALGTPTIPANYQPVFSDGDVTIYARQ